MGGHRPTPAELATNDPETVARHYPPRYEWADEQGQYDPVVGAWTLADAVEVVTREVGAMSAEYHVEDPDWARVGATVFVRANVRAIDDHDDHEHTTVEVHPDEPPCVAEFGDEHDWIYHGAVGHGGGTISTHVCNRCRLRHDVDSWAQDRSTGEQGLTSITYTRSEER